MVRRRTTKFFRAVSDLKARFRWCLTGTPIQNRLEDIGALFAFIRIRPFESLAMFRKFVSIPYDESEERRRVAIKNLTLLLESMCLRRSRALLDLPKNHDTIRPVKFSPEERRHYEQTKSAMSRNLKEKVGEEFARSQFGLFQIQLQLRILCNHGTYQPAFSWARRSLRNEHEDALCSAGNRHEVRCSICRMSIVMLCSNNVYTKYNACKHVLCSECLDGKTQESQQEESTCPLCTGPGVIGSKNLAKTTKGLEENYLLDTGHSSKIDALIEDVRKDIESTKRLVGRRKAFTSFFSRAVANNFCQCHLLMLDKYSGSDIKSAAKK